MFKLCGGVFFLHLVVSLMGVAVAPRHGGSGDLVEDSREPIFGAGGIEAI